MFVNNKFVYIDMEQSQFVIITWRLIRLVITASNYVITILTTLFYINTHTHKHTHTHILTRIYKIILTKLCTINITTSVSLF